MMSRKTGKGAEGITRNSADGYTVQKVTGL